MSVSRVERGVSGKPSGHHHHHDTVITIYHHHCHRLPLHSVAEHAWDGDGRLALGPGLLHWDLDRPVWGP